MRLRLRLRLRLSLRWLREPQPPGILVDEWFSGLVDEFADGFVEDSHVGAEFVDGEGLMVFFLEYFFDFENEFAAGAFTSAGDELDVFRVDTDSGESGFHRFCFFDEQRLENESIWSQ